MRFLVDENVRRSVVIYLRLRGYEVASISEESAGSDDRDILARAVRERRVLITNDTDFGDLIYHHSPAHRGVILFRLQVETRERVHAALELLLRRHKKDLRYFIVVEDDRVRIRP